MQKKNEYKNVYFYNMPMILLTYKEKYFNANTLDHCISIVYVPLL